MAIPARYRGHIADLCEGQLVVTIDRDLCLLIYPLPDWEVVERKLVALSSTDRRTRSLKRLLLGHAEEVEMDSHGRILLPGPLREFAGLQKRVVLVGQGNKFELWDERAWARLRDEWLAEDGGGELPPDLGSLSF